MERVGNVQHFTHSSNEIEHWKQHPLETYLTTTTHMSSAKRAIGQWFSTFVRPRPGKFFFYKTRARSQQIYS
jgi:hypothetical protein